ncbi:hypothetical protein TNIN_315841, partial [Trichonephila inaurata madagascariensis]
MVELHDQNELHIEQEVRQISLEALKAVQKCSVGVVGVSGTVDGEE